MKRKITAALIALTLCLTLIPTAHAAGSYILDPSRLHGSDYTDIPALAASLDKVFGGNPKLYSDIACTNPATAAIGSTSVPLGRTYYTRDLSGNIYSGTSCYIYANAVYASLFGDIPYHGDPGAWQNSRRVLKNAASADYDLFASAGVRCGALLRTTANPDGSYNSNLGHSVIILKYDKSSVTYLEGNGDGKGIVRVTTRDWKNLNSVSLSGRGYKISFIVQPTDEYYDCLKTGQVPKAHEYVGYLSRLRQYSGFRDVSASDWYSPGVSAVYELGLMDGCGGNSFDPSGAITVSQAVTLAARFLSNYYDDHHSFAGGSPWYRPYYDYCALWGIDTSFSGPDMPISRSDFARLMDKALPDAARTDTVPAPFFPDVPESASWGRPIYSLARSGVIQGGDGLYRPGSTFTRAEAACILARMADKSLR